VIARAFQTIHSAGVIGLETDRHGCAAARPPALSGWLALGSRPPHRPLLDYTATYIAVGRLTTTTTRAVCRVEGRRRPRRMPPLLLGARPPGSRGREPPTGLGRHLNVYSPARPVCVKPEGPGRTSVAWFALGSALRTGTVSGYPPPAEGLRNRRGARHPRGRRSCDTPWYPAGPRLGVSRRRPAKGGTCTRVPPNTEARPRGGHLGIRESLLPNCLVCECSGALAARPWPRPPRP
jgi:hypothetical protein